MPFVLRKLNLKVVTFKVFKISWSYEIFPRSYISKNYNSLSDAATNELALFYVRSVFIFSHSVVQREQERLQKTVEKKNTQIADRSQSRSETRQQESELVLTLTRLCKEREEKVAELECELKTMVSDVTLESSHTHSNSTVFADKATITDHINTSHLNIYSPSMDCEQDGLSIIPNSNTHNYDIDSNPRRRRIIRPSSQNSAALPPTPPRSGSGRRKTNIRSRYGSITDSVCLNDITTTFLIRHFRLKLDVDQSKWRRGVGLGRASPRFRVPDSVLIQMPKSKGSWKCVHSFKGFFFFFSPKQMYLKICICNRTYHNF